MLVVHGYNEHEAMAKRRFWTPTFSVSLFQKSMNRMQ